MEPCIRWFKAPSGEAFQFECGPQGINVPRLAEKVQLKASPLEINGVVVDFHQQDGYKPLNEAAVIIGDLGRSEDNPIPVSGQPAGEFGEGHCQSQATQLCTQQQHVQSMDVFLHGYHACHTKASSTAVAAAGRSVGWDLLCNALSSSSGNNRNVWADYHDGCWTSVTLTSWPRKYWLCSSASCRLCCMSDMLCALNTLLCGVITEERPSAVHCAGGGTSATGAVSNHQ